MRPRARAQAYASAYYGTCQSRVVKVRHRWRTSNSAVTDPIVWSCLLLFLCTLDETDERRTWSDKLKWRLAVVSEGSAETRRYILLVGGFWIFRRSAPLWRGPQRWVSKFGCRSAMLSQRSPGFFFDERARKRFVELPHVRERTSAGVKSLDQLASVHASRERSDFAKRGCFWRRFGSPLSSSWPVADLDRHGGYR